MGSVPASLSLHPAAHATNSSARMTRRSLSGFGFCIFFRVASDGGMESYQKIARHLSTDHYG